MTKRARILGFGGSGALVLAGVVLVVLSGRELVQILAMVLVGLGFLLAVSLVFAEVGFSEDRERLAEGERAKRRQRKPPRQRPRLERLRGRPRRLR
jgi:hypothetical protein